jgi:hypothetical protein
MKREEAKALPVVQWFVECDAFTNESLERELSARGLGSDAVSKEVGALGSDGKLHDVLAIPSGFVRRLMAARANDRRFKFRIFKRNGPNGLLSPADFLDQKPAGQRKKLQSVAARLNEILDAKAAKAK